MSSNTPLLTRKECDALRGIAIIGIFLHNFCHLLNPIVKENEYTFSQQHVDWFTFVMQQPDRLWIAQLLSFFGHYGVPVFLFLSAYGLVRKYECVIDQEEVGIVRFIRYHYLKLFKMMIVGFVAFTMVDRMTPHSWHYDVLKIIGQLLMFNNLFPNPDRMIWPGPYWFFGLMLQLYIVYRLLLYRQHWLYTVALIAACWLVQATCEGDNELLNRLRYNFIGGMLPFGAGLLYARYGKSISQPALLVTLLISAAAIVLFSYNFQTWLFVPLFVCTASIAFVKLVVFYGIQNVLQWMGSISAALFVCHPITRKIYLPISQHGDVFTGLLLYIVSSLVLAWLFREILKRMPNPQP